MLLKLPKYKDARIRRSRDPEVLAKCDIVVDVGAVYDAQKGRFDHHQKGFVHTFYDKLENGEDVERENGVANGHAEHSGDGEIMNGIDNHDTQRPKKWRRLRAPVTKLSSAGLIYKHFGKEVLKQPQYGTLRPGVEMDENNCLGTREIVSSRLCGVYLCTSLLVFYR